MTEPRILALTVPQLGLTMKEGTLAVWHAGTGAALKAGEPVFDIETEKVTSECAAPADGVLRRQIASAGSTLPVGALVGVIAAAEVDDEEINRFVAEFKPEERV